MKKHKNNS